MISQELNWVKAYLTPNLLMLKGCLFPVAGLGTRFLPVTKVVPKELLPILNKPLIQYAIDECIEANIFNFSLVISEQKESIKSFFQSDKELENSLSDEKRTLIGGVNKIIERSNFQYAYQNKPLGLGHAILSGENTLSKENFAVILPDDFCQNINGPSVISQMAKLSERFPDKCIVAIEEVPMNEVSNYGVIKGDPIRGYENVFQVSHMVEKPKPQAAPSNLAIIGRYILTNEIFQIIQDTSADSNGEIQITDALNYLAKEGKVLAYKFQGKRIDCGRVQGYVEANNFMNDLES